MKYQKYKTIGTTFPDMTTVFSLPGEHQLKKGSLLTTLPQLSQEWRISFQFNPSNYNYNDYANLFHLTVGSKSGAHGDRTPAMWFHPSYGFVLISSISGNPNYGKHLKLNIAVNQWSTITVSQDTSSGVFTFRLVVNGVEAFAIENTAPQGFKSVKVYASNPWHEAQPGLIRSLSIQTGDLLGEIRCCLTIFLCFFLLPSFLTDLADEDTLRRSLTRP